MSAASVVVILGPVWVGVAVALFLSMMASSPTTERDRRRTRARDLGRYRHHSDANLLSLKD
jgi:hypothetical protein